MLLIGCGNMAKHGHCPQLKKLENLKLVSACDVSVEKAESFKNEFGFKRFSGDYKSELEKKDIDVVLVATTWQPRYKIIGHVPTWRPDYLSSFYPSYFRHSGLERSPNPRDFSRF
jgi:pyrroline-5-carboxylate reductase